MGMNYIHFQVFDGQKRKYSTVNFKVLRYSFKINRILINKIEQHEPVTEIIE